FVFYSFSFSHPPPTVIYTLSLHDALPIFYRQYLAYMNHINAVDFDDLIALSLWLLQDNPDVKARWQKKIAYLLVDEYQDTNACQDRKSTRLNSSHVKISYAVFCLKKKN